MAAHLSRRRLVLTAAILALGPVVPGSAVELDPSALVYKLPDQIKWNPPSAAGSQNAVLVGDPAKPGLYIVLNKWLKGEHFSRPHSHPTIGSSVSSAAPGGWGAERHSIPTTALPCRPVHS